jgi:hypothetical protein
MPKWQRRFTPPRPGGVLRASCMTYRVLTPGGMRESMALPRLLLGETPEAGFARSLGLRVEEVAVEPIER